MTALLATWFVHPLPIVGWQRIVLLLPLALAIAIVYKTTKCERVRDIPLASLVLWITIVAGMYAVGAVLLVVYQLMA